jgi:hypothetical protein
MKLVTIDIVHIEYKETNTKDRFEKELIKDKRVVNLESICQLLDYSEVNYIGDGKDQKFENMTMVILNNGSFIVNLPAEKTKDLINKLYNKKNIPVQYDV